MVMVTVVPGLDWQWSPELDTWSGTGTNAAIGDGKAWLMMLLVARLYAHDV